MKENLKELVTTDHKPFYETKESRNIGTFLLFIIWPMLSLAISFKQYKHYSSRNVIWMFTAFLGLTLYFDGDMDSTRYSDELSLYFKLDYGIIEFFKYVFFDPDAARLDFVQPLITFLVSKITEDPSILLGAFGLFFGYFYSRNIWFLIDRIKGKIKAEALAYFLLFCFLIPIWSINGFRFWAAAHVFIYGVINFFYAKNKSKGIFFVIFSFFIHDTYIIAISLFFIYLLIRKKTTAIFYFYLITIFIGGIGRSYVGDIFNSSSAGLKDRSAYTSDEYKELTTEQKNSYNWYVKYQYTMMKLLVAGSLIWIFYKRKKVLETLDFNVDFFCLGLLFLSFTNLTQDIPSMERFYFIGFMFVSLMLFIFFQNTNFNRRPQWYKLLSLGIITITIVVQLWTGSIFFSIATTLANPMTISLFEKENINTLIKGLLGS